MAPTIQGNKPGISVANPAEYSGRILLETSGFKPRWLVELGSGFERLSRLLPDVGSLVFSRLPGFPTPTTPGHTGVVRFYRGSRNSAYIFYGRSHLYEGVSPVDTATVIHLAKALCIEGVILCSACGAIAGHIESGDLLLFDGALRLPFSRQRPNWSSDPAISLSSKSAQRVGFDRRLSSILQNSFTESGVCFKTGVIGIVSGPNYETPAEVEMLRRLGASAVTMSCAPVLQLAFELKIPVIMLGGVTNRAGVVGSAPLEHQLILEEADKKIVPKLAKLFTHLLGAPWKP